MKKIEQPHSEKTLIFIPTFNDLVLLPSIIKGVQALDDSFVPLIIDDGSSPQLQGSTLPEGCFLFSLPDNLGLGTCTHIALDHALKFGYKALIRIDSDGQHPLEMIPEMLLPLQNDKADVVVGTRENHSEGSGIGIFFRNLVKSYFTFIAIWLTRGGVPTDVNSGFFALNQKAMIAVNSSTLERFPEPQMLILAHSTGLRITEISITQSSRQYGTTTLSVLQAARLIYRFSVFAAAEILSFRR